MSGEAAQVAAAAERARKREVQGIVRALVAEFDVNETEPFADERSVQVMGERLHRAGLRATMPPRPPWLGLLTDEACDRLLEAVRRADGGPAFAQTGRDVDGWLYPVGGPTEVDTFEDDTTVGPQSRAEGPAVSGAGCVGQVHEGLVTGGSHYGCTLVGEPVESDAWRNVDEVLAGVAAIEAAAGQTRAALRGYLRGIGLLP